MMNERLRALLALTENVEIADASGLGDGSLMEIDPEKETLTIVFELEDEKFFRCTITVSAIEETETPDWVKSLGPWLNADQRGRYNRWSGTEIRNARA